MTYVVHKNEKNIKNIDNIFFSTLYLEIISNKSVNTEVNVYCKFFFQCGKENLLLYFVTLPFPVFPFWFMPSFYPPQKCQRSHPIFPVSQALKIVLTLGTTAS